LKKHETENSLNKTPKHRLNRWTLVMAVERCWRSNIINKWHICAFTVKSC